jgi:predicted Zn finger-like uncharacterized protein
MILTCPACATRYSVADNAIGPAGKAVRCAGCSHRWTALPTDDDDALDLTASAPPARPAAQPAASATTEPDPADSERPTPNQAPAAFREKAHAQKTIRLAVVNGVIWAGIGATVAVLAALSIIFRVDVVRVLPRTASAYAAVGLAVNPTGLVFEGVSAKPGLQDGHDALVVSGAVRNIEKRALASPALAIKVLDKAGQPVLIRTTEGDASLILPGQTHNFVISVLDPPATANDVEVAIAPGHRSKTAIKAASAPIKAAAAPAAGPPLRGTADTAPAPIPTTPTPIMDLAPGASTPAPVPARPVSDNSPYALHGTHG